MIMMISVQCQGPITALDHDHDTGSMYDHDHSTGAPWQQHEY